MDDFDARRLLRLHNELDSLEARDSLGKRIRFWGVTAFSVYVVYLMALVALDAGMLFEAIALPSFIAIVVGGVQVAKHMWKKQLREDIAQLEANIERRAEAARLEPGGQTE